MVLEKLGDALRETLRKIAGASHISPELIKELVRDIQRVPEMMPRKKDNSLGNEPVFLKLGKSIVASRDLSAGDVITVDDLSGNRILLSNMSGCESSILTLDRSGMCHCSSAD